MKTRSFMIGPVALLITALVGLPADAREESGGAAEMARLLQDPLATLSAIMTDNAISFGQGDDNETGYEFQLQPVYSIPAPDLGVNVIPRAIIPIVEAPGAAMSRTGRSAAARRDGLRAE